MHQPQRQPDPDRNWIELRWLLLRVDAKRYDHRLGRIVQHLLVIGHPDAHGHLSTQQWRHRCRFKLFGSQACYDSDGRRLFDLFLCARHDGHQYWPMGQWLFFEHFADAYLQLPPKRWHRRCSE